MQIYFYSLGNLDDFYLGTWLIFTWELGSFLLGKLDGFHNKKLVNVSKKYLPALQRQIFF